MSKKQKKNNKLMEPLAEGAQKKNVLPTRKTRTLPPTANNNKKKYKKKKRENNESRAKSNVKHVSYFTSV